MSLRLKGLVGKVYMHRAFKMSVGILVGFSSVALMSDVHFMNM